MSFSCPICSDSLSRVPADPTNTDGSKISCAPCGHLFHAFCIQKWLGGSLATSSQCPCCRVNIPKKKCLPLYPTVHDDTILDSSVGDVECNHGPVLDDLRLQVQKLKRELAHSEQLKNTLSDDFERSQSKLRSERVKNEQLLIRFKQMESLETYTDELKAKLDVAQAQLNSMKAVQTVIDSVRNDIEYEQQDYSFTRESMETLKTINGILARELKATINKHKEALSLQESLRTKSRKACNEITKLKQNNEDLQNRAALLKMELEDLQAEAQQDVTMNSTIHPTRKRKSESQKLSNDDSVILVDQDVDEDIMILKPFHLSRKLIDPYAATKLKTSSDLHSNIKCKAQNRSDAVKNSQSAKDSISDSSSSVSVSKNKNREEKKSKIDSDNIHDLSAIRFSANLKTSLPGLTVTPPSTYGRVGSTGFGVPKPSRVLKK